MTYVGTNHNYHSLMQLLRIRSDPSLTVYDDYLSFAYTADKQIASHYFHIWQKTPLKNVLLSKRYSLAISVFYFSLRTQNPRGEEDEH